jgi:hypothetical protein
MKPTESAGEDREAWFDELYPDLRAAGGLHVSLQSRLPRVVLNPPVPHPFLRPDANDHAGAAAGERSIGVGLGCEQRVFVGEFWEAGVRLGNYKSTSLGDVADLFERWLTSGELASRLSGSDTTELRPAEWALDYEQGPEAYVAFWWENSLQYPYDARVRPMVEAAAQVPVLRGLRPYTSHNVLRFSRSIGYPFSDDCPWITPEDAGLYSVTDVSGSVVGSGSAREAALLAASLLPVGTGPAQCGPWPEAISVPWKDLAG